MSIASDEILYCYYPMRVFNVDSVIPTFTKLKYKVKFDIIRRLPSIAHKIYTLPPEPAGKLPM